MPRSCQLDTLPRIWLSYSAISSIGERCSRAKFGKPKVYCWYLRAFAPSQWETESLCNDVSHWLGENQESACHSHRFSLDRRWSSTVYPGGNGIINSLWPSDAIRGQGTEPTLAQVMACCLTAPSHYLNQCWLVISKVLWYSSEGTIMIRSEEINQ